ncbi:MAG: VOC family protein [Actinobacteria bacterium]|nr:VOC family protein [Actinomycetota bacterium]
MSRNIQVAIDCRDPHTLNRFWAEVMEYEVEDHHDLIEQLMAGGLVTEADTISIAGRRAFATAAACRDSSGHGRLLFQQVPEDKVVKNRVHLDVHADDRDALVARCLELGATKLWDGHQGPETWVTLADPEGNEFCIS